MDCFSRGSLSPPPCLDKPLRYRNTGWGALRSMWFILIVRHRSFFFFFFSIISIPSSTTRRKSENRKRNPETQSQFSSVLSWTRIEQDLDYLFALRWFNFSPLALSESLWKFKLEARRKWALILLISYLVERVCSRQSRERGRREGARDKSITEDNEINTTQAMWDYFSNGRKMFISL